MKTVLFTLATIISLHLAKAQEATSKTESGITITVTVPVKIDKGTVIGGVYNETSFMKGAPNYGYEATIEDGKAVLIFSNIPPGTYGITLFHDTNGNKTMDFETNGMPKEMYGVSNNIMSYGPPQWSDAKFEVASEDIEMEIRL